MAPVPISERAGLQAERTDMSWARTALSLLVNGGLMLMRHHLGAPSLLTLIVVGFAFSLLVFTLIMSGVRRRAFAQRPLPEPLAAPQPVFLLAVGAAVLGLLTIAELLLA